MTEEFLKQKENNAWLFEDNILLFSQ
jgi:hypothetical protein